MLENLFEKLNTLKDVFIHELKDVYDAEQQIIDALPKMIEKASKPELVRALSEHLETTRQQSNRLVSLFQTLGVESAKQTCAGIKGILSEGSSTVGRVAEQGSVMDAVIIAACQKVEHYEICAYGTLCAFAKEIGDVRSLEVLKQTLSEEKQADELLTQIAQGGGVNAPAAARSPDKSAPRPPRDKTTR